MLDEKLNKIVFVELNVHCDFFELFVVFDDVLVILLVFLVFGLDFAFDEEHDEFGYVRKVLRVEVDVFEAECGGV